MPARILDGTKIANDIRSEVAAEAKTMAAAGIRPGLAVILVGHNPASEIYVRGKVKACEQVGLYSEQHTPPETSTTADLLALVEQLNRRDEIDGILVQLPLPSQVDSKKVLMAVDPAKDVDGFHPVNVGFLSTQRPGLVPCTPAGVIEILKRSQIPIAGQEAVVVGRSDIVGKPAAMLLLNANATVTVCHSKTRDLWAVCAPGRHSRSGDRPRRHDHARFREARCNRDRCWHEPGDRSRRIPAPVRRRPGRWIGRERQAGSVFSGERIHAGRRRAPRSGRSGGSADSRSRRRWSSDHSDADV